MYHVGITSAYVLPLLMGNQEEEPDPSWANHSFQEDFEIGESEARLFLGGCVVIYRLPLWLKQ